MPLINGTNVFKLFTLALSVWEPKCRSRSTSDVVCVAGTEDYILKRGLVSDNNNTFSIKLKGCRITDIYLDSFKNDFNLAELDLSRNKIKSLKKEVFNGIKKLRILNLSQNMLETLPLGIFDHLPRLHNFEIANNNLLSLELGLFNHVSSLVSLSVARNKFVGRNLDPAFFKQVPNLAYLYLSGNNMSLTTDDLLQSLRKLRVLELSDCSLTEVPKFATSINLTTMKRLLLRKNIIKKLNDPEAFTNLENLVTLDLLENTIDTLHDDVFKPLTKLALIDLSFNKIEKIPDNLFSDMDTLRSVDLSYNFIKNVPMSVFHGTNLQTLRLNGNRITHLERNFCAELQRANNSLTTFEFQDNPFQCACLLELLNEVKKFDIEYNSDKYNGDHPVCVMTNEFQCSRRRKRFF